MSSVLSTAAPPHRNTAVGPGGPEGCTKLWCGAVQLRLMTKLGFVSLVIGTEVATRVSPVSVTDVLKPQKQSLV